MPREPSGLPRQFQSLPLFPLPRVVLLPHSLLPLHVFEPRYRALVDDLLRGDGLLGVPRIVHGSVACGECPPFAPVMGLGRLVRHQRLPDGRSNIVVLGMGRVRCDEEHEQPDVPYRIGACTLLDCDEASAPSRLQQSAEQLRYTALQLARWRPDAAEELQKLLSPDRDLSETVDILAHMCIRDTDERQAYLELDCPLPRVERVLAALTSIVFDHQTRPDC